MSDGISNEPVIAPLPTPVSVEPRAASPGEVAEVARQSEEAKIAANARKAPDPKAAEPAKDEPKPKLSTREAIRAAAAKVHAEPTAEKASPLKVEPKAAAEPVAAKNAPAPAKDTKAAEPVKDAPAAPVRGEDGKFVSVKAAEPAPAADAAKVDTPAKPAALPSHTAEPPPARFSPAAKEKWAEAPDEVRAEVTRAVTELTKGFEKHRAAAERDASLAEFHEMAGKSNKALK